ncbi:cellulose biosynthesis protein BcsQ [Paracraurococcus ruber]|uniref:Cellulose synthase operon protein YhjQ n=1 Tax=Paracraurococcus ruber TaxID=77675 RepID=A0ABS1CVY4_9PROT|nr:cellulose biosynthesis protein BcsQ [Paracraurococcus ruber]MBK1658401.1 cellulose synthase operon protein YhjQ [Paracraurococcus ruber]TDG30749.1 cellulose synthase operon protein YhjQ [Paracraurococcus ruber]
MPLICVCSPKGGAGKTMLAANMAQLLRRFGQRVVAVDLDPQNALRLHFGEALANEGGFLAGRRAALNWHASATRVGDGVLILPHGATDANERLVQERRLELEPALLADLVAAMLAEPDLIVIVDTPPGVSTALTAVLPRADIILVPLLADGGSMAVLPDIEAGRFLGRGTLGRMLFTRVRFVLNQVEAGSPLSAAVAEGLLPRFGPHLLGFVARDAAVAEAFASGALVADYAPDSRAAADLLDLARILERLILSGSGKPASVAA